MDYMDANAPSALQQPACHRNSCSSGAPGGAGTNADSLSENVQVAASHWKTLLNKCLQLAGTTVQRWPQPGLPILAHSLSSTFQIKAVHVGSSP